MFPSDAMMTIKAKDHYYLRMIGDTKRTKNKKLPVFAGSLRYVNSYL